MSEEKHEDSFAAMFEREAAKPVPKKKRYRVGERVSGVVVRVGRDAVFVELDGKQQAFFEAVELRDAEGNIALAEGDRVDANVVESDEARGVIRLGRSLGRVGDVAGLETAKEAKLAVEGKVTGVNKGGLEVEIGGARAFCPMSQADARFLEDPKTLIGQNLRFLVTDVRDGGKNVVVSRRALLEREQQENASQAMAKVVPGAVIGGTVTSVRDFGAFVDLGGVEGLIPRSEIAHDRGVAVADALKAGDTVQVQVREVKEKKITLSLKALTADPWGDVELPIGRVYEGTVVRKADFGRFVRLLPGVEGLLHVSELSKSTKAEEGEQLLVVVKKLDKAAKKISLGLAPEGAAAGSTVTTDVGVKVGAVVSGVVERIETYGLFVQLDGTKGRAGRGLVPNAEIGVPRGTDLRKTHPEGTKVTAKVLETGEGRLRLSIKGALEAAERADYEEARAKTSAPTSLGTFADLLKGIKPKK